MVLQVPVGGVPIPRNRTVLAEVRDGFKKNDSIDDRTVLLYSSTTRASEIKA